MKTVLIVALLGALAASYFYMSPASSPLETEYQAYLAKFGKSYNSVGEYDMRLKIFEESVRLVEEDNKKNSWTSALNQFSDMTEGEFKKTLGFKQMPTGQRITAEVTGFAPESIDWREKGAVNPIKNQGACGSCWAFSAIGALEGHHFLKHKELKRFSEQQLVDCSRDFGNEGCNGGFMEWAFQYLEKFDTIEEDKYPYTAHDDACKYEERKEGAVHNVDKIIHVKENDNQALKEAIAEGPVSVAVQANGPFMSYSSGILTGKSCGTQLDHGITAVGYGSENGVDYYIVRNSWGGSWGEQGYIRIGMDADCEAQGGVCGILMVDDYPEEN